MSTRRKRQKDEENGIEEEPVSKVRRSGRRRRGGDGGGGDEDTKKDSTESPNQDGEANERSLETSADTLNTSNDVQAKSDKGKGPATVPTLGQGDTDAVSLKISQNTPEPSPAQPAMEDEFDEYGDDASFLNELISVADNAQTAFSSSSAPASPVLKKQPDILMVTRSVVLQMFAIAVCTREGYSHGTSVSFAKVLASEFAKTRAKTLGLAERDSVQDEKYKKAMRLHNARKVAGSSVELYPAFGTEVLAGENQAGEVRGILADENSATTVDSKSAETYLKSQLGQRYEEIQGLMNKIAAKHGRDEIGKVAYSLYERMRPPFTSFGAKSPWDLDEVRRMADA